MNTTASIFFFFCILLIKAIADAKRDTYIVHMDSSAMPKPFSSHHGWYTSIVASILDDDRVSKHHSDLIIYSYTNAIHGFSAILSPSELASIKKSPSFLSAARDTKLKLSTTHSSDFIGLNSLSGAWPVSEFGRDVIIGVVDTGIWPESKSFSDEGLDEIPARWNGGCYGGVDFNTTLCNKKLIGVRFFNKGTKAQYPNNIYVDSARDNDGHGTHVSSTAAGNFVQGASYFGYASGTAKGMAPRARLAMYKVEKDFVTSDVIAAIDSAIEDKIDILSLSIGSPPPPPPLYHDPLSIAHFAAMENGIFISAAGGNSGPYVKSICNAAPWILTVGAGTTDRTFSGTVLLGNGAYLSGSSFYTLPVIPANLPITYQKSCNKGEVGLPNSGEKIVVCVVNDTEFDAYYRPSFEGAAGVVVIWNSSSSSYLRDLPDGELSFPVVFVSSGTGKVIMDYINDNHQPTATLWFKETNHGTKPSPKVVVESSRGPSPASPFILKPDVLAPGYQILASWPESTPITLYPNGQFLFNKFNVMSGTSMASPHVAGVAALLRGVHPDWSSARIRSAIMTTADPLDNLLSPIQEQGYKRIASPLAIGAGHISPNKALEPGLVYDVHVDDYVNLLCAMNLTSKQIHAITKSRRSCSKPSLDLNYPSFIAYFNCNGTKSVHFKRTLTNVGDDKSTYYAELAPIKGFNVSITPKKLIFKKKLERHKYELKINGPCLEEETIVHGSITWLKVGGKPCSVRSPIVVVGLNPHNLHGDDDH